MKPARYRSKRFTVPVPRAFANAHMSGCKSGSVAFGKFSSATTGNPLFECSYPIVLTGAKSYGPSANLPANAVEGQLFFVVE